jgi:hypothetical protein
MNYELEIPGWKIALNVTEFLMPSASLETIENQLKDWGRTGCACSGIICIDHAPETLPTFDQSLPLQKFWGIDDNLPLSPTERTAIGLGSFPARNRFYHCNPVGMYYPGRHGSFHPDSQMRISDLMIFSYSFAPWNNQSLNRKLQIKSRLNAEDLKRGWGAHHTKDVEKLNAEFDQIKKSAIDLHTHPYANNALKMNAL